MSALLAWPPWWSSDASIDRRCRIKSTLGIGIQEIVFGEHLMNFEFDSSLDTFRQEVRAFIAGNLPEDMAWRARHGGYLGLHSDRVAWTKILHRKGWSVPHWPVEYGGTGWSPLYHHVFSEESMLASAPRPPTQGPLLAGLSIIAVGTEEQKRKFLPPIGSGDHIWCQGFSEPNAGSDLASLRTSAVRDGDHYVVRGQKVWTSAAHVADWGFFLVRTSNEPKRQLGISFLLIDMRSPGITVRPLITIDGQHHTNEVFLDDVKVPVENLLGDEGKGWHYAKTLLGHERTASAEIYWSRNEIEKIKEIALLESQNGKSLLSSMVYRHKLIRLELELRALEYSVLRMLSSEENKFPAAAISSALKVRGAELMQRISDFEIELLGPKATRYFPAFRMASAAPNEAAWPHYTLGKAGSQLTLRAATVFGGAREIQKNIIAKTAFGL